MITSSLTPAFLRSEMIRELRSKVESMDAFLNHHPLKVKTPYPSEAHFVLAHGRFFEPVPFPATIQRMMMPKESFWNAHSLVKRFPKKFRYVEGFASMTRLHPEPVLHAWVIDQKDCAIDPTWDNGVEYFGVEFAREYVERNGNGDLGWNSLLDGAEAILLGQHTEKDWKPKDARDANGIVKERQKKPV